jgi:hypothetical protein
MLEEHPLSAVLTYYCGVHKIEKNEMSGACSSDREGRGVYWGSVGRPEGKRLLGRPRRRWEDNTKMDLQEVRCRGMDWIELAQNRDRWVAFGCGNESSGSIKCGEYLN